MKHVHLALALVFISVSLLLFPSCGMPLSARVFHEDFGSVGYSSKGGLDISADAKAIEYRLNGPGATNPAK